MTGGTLGTGMRMDAASLLLDDTAVRGGEREEHVLAVDFGTSTTRAVLVGADGRDRVVKDPMSGSWRWASAVFADESGLRFGAAAQAGQQVDPARYLREFKRLLGRRESVRLGGTAVSCTELVARLLAAVRDEATAMLPAGSRVTRAVVTVPAGYAPEGLQWTAMLQACERAGFEDTELLSEPVAAALGCRPPEHLPAGATALVYDLGGGTFDTALLRYDADPREHGRAALMPRVLGHASLDSCGGRDIDGALMRWLRSTCAQWLEPLLAEGDPAALGRVLALADFARKVKHRLSGVDAVEDRLFPESPVVQLSRERLVVLCQDLIARTVDCCRGLLHRHDVSPDDITHVLMTGGGSRMPAVRSAVEAALRRPLTRAEDPDLAVVLGARLWAAGQGGRRLPAHRPAPGTEALSWRIPGGSARLVRWLRAPGDAYGAGTTLARVRLTDGSLHDLTAAGPGRVLRRHAAPAQRVADGDWLVTSRRPPHVAELPAVPRPLADHEVQGPVLAVAWSPDGRRLHAAGDGWAHTFDASAWKPSGAFPEAGQGRFLAVDGSGLRIAFVTRDGEAAVAAVDGLTAAAALGIGPVPGPMAFGPAGGVLAVARHDAAVDLRAVGTTGTTDAVRVLRVPADDVTDGAPRQAARIRDLAFDPTGRRITAVSRVRRAEGRVTTWRVGDGEVLADLRLDTPVERVAYGSDGRLAASGPGGGPRSRLGPEAVVWLWETDEAGVLHPVSAPDATPAFLARRSHGYAPAVAFGPDGLLLAEGGQDGSVRLWDAECRREVRTYTADGVVRTLAFSPDGHVLAVGTDQGLTTWALGAVPDPQPPKNDCR